MQVSFDKKAEILINLLTNIQLKPTEGFMNLEFDKVQQNGILKNEILPIHAELNVYYIENDSGINKEKLFNV